MAETSFDKILDPRYKIHLDTIYEALDAIGYKINEDINGISATKKIDNYRFHFIIVMLPNGEVDRYCSINLHKDTGISLFHGTVENDEDIDNELDLFVDTLTKVIKRKRKNFKKHRNYYKNRQKNE